MRGWDTDLSEAPSIQLAGEACKLSAAKEKTEEVLDECLTIVDYKGTALEYPRNGRVLLNCLLDVGQHEHELK